MSGEAQKVCFVVNPASASGKTGRLWPTWEAVLRDKGVDFTTLRTTRRGEAMELCRKALQDGATLVVSVGGDGTNNEVVNGFFDEAGEPLREDAAFSFVPSGSGSDLQRTLPACKAAEELAEMILDGETRLLDVGRLSLTSREKTKIQRYFLNITSFGMSGMVTDLANRSWLKRISGTLAFHVASVRGFFGFPNVPMRVIMDDKEPYDTMARMGALANGRCFGGGMQMAPNARMDDGQFDLVLLERFSLLGLLLKFGSIYKGEHIKLENVSHHLVKKIEVTSEGRDVLMEIDGEVLGMLPLSCEVMSSVLRFRQRKDKKALEEGKAKQ